MAVSPAAMFGMLQATAFKHDQEMALYQANRKLINSGGSPYFGGLVTDTLQLGDKEARLEAMKARLLLSRAVKILDDWLRYIRRQQWREELRHLNLLG
jgi:hypothetical protein